MNISRKPGLFRFLLSVCALLFSVSSLRAGDLGGRIDSLLRDKQMTVGVAVECPARCFTYSRNPDGRFPLMSVFKVHVALTVLEELERRGVSPDTLVHVSRKSLLPDTYSPLRMKFPNQDLDISVRELIRYAVAESDNNACDVLIELAGGIGEVDASIRRLGISDFQLTETEAGMHADLRRCYRNWSTPVAMNALLQIVASGTAPRFSLLRRTMGETVTGTNKIVAGLPEGVVALHKTGSSDRIDGVKTGDNDAAILRFSDGTTCYLTVFIQDSKESDEVNAATIAAITREVVCELFPVGR